MKIPKILPRVFSVLCIALIFALDLLPSQPVQAGQVVIGSGPFKYYLPMVGRTEDPVWMGPNGGSAIHMISDPHNANIVYAGSFGAGVFKSTDGGVTWTASSAGLFNLTIYCLAIDPQNSNIIYAGSYGAGVFKSTNAGASWAQVSTGMNLPLVIYTLAVNPGNGNLVYAGTRLENSLDGILYKSSNGGASWQAVFSQKSDWVYSIAANQNDPDVVLAAAHEHGPYISTNYGSNWGATSLTSSTWAETAKGRVVAFDPRYASRAYYATWHGDFFRSSNGGSSWQASSTGLADSHIYPNGISVNPSNPDTIYMAAHSGSVAGVVKSTNGGESWGGAGLNGETVYTVTAPGGDNLLAGTYLNGIYRSTNGGGSWSPAITGFTNAQVTGMVFLGNNTVVASTMGSGVQISTDGGVSWRDYSGGIGDRFITGLYYSPANANILFALTSSAGLYRIDRSVYGSGWVSTVVPAAAAMSTEAADQTPRLPLVRRDAIDEYLELEGETATASSGLQAQGLVTDGIASPITMAFAPSNPNIAYLGTSRSGLYASSNGGLNWTQVSLAGTEVRSIAVNPTNPNHLYIATNQTNRIKVSGDGGRNWADVAVPASSIYALAISPVMPGWVFLGTSSGLWINTGDGWYLVPGTTDPVKVLGVHPDRPEMIVAGTDSSAFVFTFSYDFLLMIAQFGSGGGVQSLAFEPNNLHYAYFGTVSRSTVRVPLYR